MPIILAATIASTAGVFAVILSQSVSGNPTDVQGVLTQLGIFGAVIAVFKFMLNRSDQRDADQEKRDATNLEALRKQADAAREEAQTARERADAVLAKEREAHDKTRGRLYDALMLVSAQNAAAAAGTTNKPVQDAQARMLERIQLALKELGLLEDSSEHDTVA